MFLLKKVRMKNVEIDMTNKIQMSNGHLREMPPNVTVEEGEDE